MTPTHTGMLHFEDAGIPPVETQLQQLPGGGWLDNDGDRYYPSGDHHSDKFGRRREYRIDADSIKLIAGLQTDEELRNEWRAAGGHIHGPNTETVTMPETAYFAFRRSFPK